MFFLSGQYDKIPVQEDSNLSFELWCHTPLPIDID